MSYDKNNFKSGDRLYAKQLNNMGNQIKSNEDVLDIIQAQFTSQATAINDLSEKKIDGAYVENGYLFLTSNGEVVVSNLGPFSGGSSGSGSGNAAKLVVKNTSGWLSKTIGENQNCNVVIDWSSLEDGLTTGNGTVKIMVNGVLKTTYDIAQGSIAIDLSPYLSAGSNSIKLTISDVYGNSRTISFSVNVISISLTSTFDSSVVYDRDINFTCIPIGEISKTLYITIDGSVVAQQTVTTSNRQITVKISKLTNGSHVLTAYFVSIIDDNEIQSNILRYDLICSDSTNETPVITSSYADETAKQYDTAKIEYYVYNPKSLTSTVELIVDGETVSTLIGVDRTKQLWSYRYNTSGSHTLKIKCGATVKTFNISVEATDLGVSAETSDLSLYLTAYGRSNNESDPSKWNYEDIKSILKNFNFKSDGWVNDEDGNTVLRVAGDARVEIPVKVFQNDFRTAGKTIEVEFATRDVFNYDAIVMSCYAEDKGLKYSAQMIEMYSEQSYINTQYKEDEHVRVSFVVEKKSENRLIYIYINGIASGVIQYPTTDDFTQATPVNITIGSNDCTIDIYTIRIYENDLTRYQILDNFIADTQNIDELLDRYERNNIFDDYGKIVISKLPNYLPYLIINATELPQSKGDKKTVSGSFINPEDPSRNFTFENAEFDVQGTSSAGYARKNYKGKFKGGFIVNGETIAKYSLREGSIPESTFTFKADVASSEGCNNVELVRLYNDNCPFKTPPQKTNSAVRQGIDGFPMVIFWNNGTETVFLGKYNFNNDKGTEKTFGFTEGDESWEFLNNTSDRTLFKSDDFSTDDWMNDFEARYPTDNTDCTNLKAVATWLKSTMNDIDKFKSEFETYFELDAMAFYYVFTELFLMVDSRAKNMFLSKIGGSKWFILPYDFDTAIGINNEGTLAFSYNLEDTDQVDSADVFNGQQSTLWVNFRQAFADKIKSTYSKLRSSGTFSYDVVEKQFEDHQSKWSEAIFNEDAYFKYIQPLLESGTSAYLSMLQGSKTEQRRWWLYNRFRYLDSKYVAGDALKDIITLRGYAKGDITITPYADIYASVKYGSYLVQKRAERNKTYTLECPLDNVNDTEIYVYNCSQLSSIGDISSLMVGYADFSLATRLSALKIGDSATSYSNTNLKELYLGNNTLLKTLDVRNCPNLSMAVDISQCSNVEEVYFDGTSITALQLPNGGILKKLHLPGTITNLTLQNQTAMSELVVPSYSNISTLWIENIPSNLIDPVEVLGKIKDNSRVRVIGFSSNLDEPSEVYDLFDKFDTFRGLDEHGNNTDKPQLSGTIHVKKITANQLRELSTRYPDITITYDVITFKVEFYNGESLVDTQYVEGSKNATYGGTKPTKQSDVYYTYAFAGWSTTKGGEVVEINALRNITGDRKVYAVYNKTDVLYTIRFINDGSVLQTGTYKYGETPVYSGSTPVSSEGYEFNGWSPDIGPVTKSMDYTAMFLTKPTLIKTWYNSDNLGDLYDAEKITSLKFLPDFNPESYDIKVSVAETSTPVWLYAIGTDITITWDSSNATKLIIHPDGTNGLFGTTSTFAANSTLNVSNLDLSETRKLTNVFRYCNPTVIDGLSTLDTSNITVLQAAFAGCRATQLIGLDDWDVSNVYDMTSAFYECWVTNLDLSSWNTKNLENISHIFQNCKATSIDVSGWNTAKTKTISYAFSDCYATTIYGLNTWNVSNVEKVYNAFSECRVDSLDLSGWNPLKVTSMFQLFTSCRAKTINISDWQMLNITGLYQTFDGCSGYLLSLTIPATNGNGLVNTTSTLYGKDSTVSYDLTKLYKATITVAS